MTDAFSDAIRSAAFGRRSPTGAERPVGDVGIGKGSAAVPRRYARSLTVTDQIRAGVRAHRESRGVLAEGEAQAREMFDG